jgi:KDO2-lipid IV(A) lauroyltransferase
MRQRFELMGVRILMWLPSVLPLRVSVKMSAVLGIFAFDVVRIRRRVTLDNLERAFGALYSPRERRGIGRRSYVNFAKSMVEFAALGKVSRSDLVRLVEMKGKDHLDGALEKGKGAIIVTGHFGSWEFLGAAAVAFGIPADFLVGAQSNRLVNDLMNALRRQAGIGIIRRGAAIRGIFTSLKRNRVVALLSDQDARSHGVFVDFFGTPASTYPGAAQFSLRSGAPILFCYNVRRKDETHEAVFLPPIEPNPGAAKEAEILRLTAAHVKALEDAVRLHPDHYFWAHKRWKTKPAARTAR